MKNLLLGSLILWTLGACTPSPKTPPVPPRSLEELARLESDPEILEHGRRLYQSRCLSCHGPQGEGRVGPNLTDEFWIHGSGDLKSLLIMVQKGAPTKGMPAWEQLMTAPEIEAVTLFTKSLIGTRPADSKAPQGHRAPAP